MHKYLPQYYYIMLLIIKMSTISINKAILTNYVTYIIILIGRYNNK